MKKLVGIALLLFIVAIALPAEEAELFVVTRHITKIYIHRLGFRVVYLKTNMELADFYVPMTWFDEASGKGTLIRGQDSSYPFFSIFWEPGKPDGERFHSVKLYTKTSLAHETWGTLTHREGIDKLFDVDEIQIEF